MAQLWENFSSKFSKILGRQFSYRAFSVIRFALRNVAVDNMGNT